MTDLEWHENKLLRRMEVAAPKMLEALQKIARGDDGMDSHTAFGMRDIARAAIAAATGEP
jgi:hypothetical protein